MLRKIFLLIVIFACQLLTPIPVAAIYNPLSVPNNPYGIHILEVGELQKAAELVNSTGGEWGYVTIPIRSNERDVEKWTKFMTEAKRLKLIPILRIASYPVGDHWMAPNEWDLVDFANFLDDLPWPTKNRYIMVYNEPNHQGEWGGFVYPEEYARVLDRATDIFHKKHPDFFVITGGLDAAAPNGSETLDNLTYLKRMETYIPGIFHKVDGISVHAYGNPAFTSPPNSYNSMNIKSYVGEEALLKTFGVENKPLFLTEAGWKADSIGETQATIWYQTAFKDFWTEPNIVAITPFLLSAQAGPFAEFSFTRPDGQFEPFAKSIQSFPKTQGQPQLAEQKPKTNGLDAQKLRQTISKGLKKTNSSLEDIFSKIFSFLNFN